MQLQLIRSATVRIRAAGRVLLIDPYLADVHAGFSYAGRLRSPLVPLPMPVDDLLRDVDAVFVSHLHSDHFDAAARAVLPRTMPMLCPAALEPRLREFGFERVTPIGDRLQWFDFELVLTGGRHGPDDIVAAMGPVNGLVIRVQGAPVLYWIGDSIWCDDVRAAIDTYQPAFIVAHACGATAQGKGPLVMDEAHVEALLRHAADARVIATHMDCVDHATVSRADLLRHFAPLPDLRARLAIPADGDVLTLGE